VVKQSTGYGADAGAGYPTISKHGSGTQKIMNCQSSSDTTFETEPSSFARHSAARDSLYALDNEVRDKRISDLELEMKFLAWLAGLSAVLIVLYFITAVYLK
jgi:hypothetical protein